MYYRIRVDVIILCRLLSDDSLGVMLKGKPTDSRRFDWLQADGIPVQN